MLPSCNGWPIRACDGCMRELPHMTCAEQVSEQPPGAGDALGQLAVERVGDIDVLPPAILSPQQAPALRVLSGIGGLGQGRIPRVPAGCKAMTALFKPACDISLGDAIGPGEQRVA